MHYHEELLLKERSDRIVSDGWSSSYYDIPEHVRDLDDLIVYLGLSWHVANIMKACFRIGRKDGTSDLYDINKILWFAKRSKENLEKSS